MKKAIFVLAIVLLLVSVMGISAFARGHGYAYMAQTQQTQQTRYAVCTVADCEIIGVHQHGDAWYCSTVAGGCYSYEICTVDDCTQVGIHEHDGVYYRCATTVARQGCGRGWAR